MVKDVVAPAEADPTFFFGKTGSELWKSDGTAAGTVMVKDITPAINSNILESLTEVGSTLFFVANDGANGYELWKSDGTTAGTAMVEDIRPGTASGYPTDLTAVGATLFFLANDGTNRYELWKSDGTAEGTVLLKNADPGVGAVRPGHLTAVGSTLFFQASDGANGYELWKSDGTAAGTVMVKDIGPGPAQGGPENLMSVGSSLYFTANDGVHGNELWKSDGSEAGTTMIGDLTGDSGGSSPSQVCRVGQQVFFSAYTEGAGRELYVYPPDEPFRIPEISVQAPTGFELPMNGELSFGEMGTTRSSTLKSITVRNTGDGLLLISKVTVTGVNSADFTFTKPALPCFVEPGGSMSIGVVFSPAAGTSSGARSGSLQIVSNDDDERWFDISLAGFALTSTGDTDGDGLNG
jgi:ELWxxDGT repeat protein